MCYFFKPDYRKATSDYIAYVLYLIQSSASVSEISCIYKAALALVAFLRKPSKATFYSHAHIKRPARLQPGKPSEDLP